jgi:hypothetical protein
MTILNYSENSIALQKRKPVTALKNGAIPKSQTSRKKYKKYKNGTI